MTTTTHHVNIPTDPADIPPPLIEQPAPKSNRKRNGAILGVTAVTVALIAIIGLTTTRNSEGGGVSATTTAGVSSTACFAALAAGSDLDGYMSDFAVIAADGATASFNRDVTDLQSATARMNTLNPKISTARTTLAAQSAQCRRDLMGTN